MIKIYWDNDMSEWWSLEIPDLIPSWQPSVVQTVSKASLHFPLDNIPKKVNQYLYLKDFFWVEQACKSRSYANPKLSPTNWPTHRRGCSLKCGATSVAKKGNQIMKTLMALTRLENIGLGTLKTLENPSKLQEIIFHGGKGAIWTQNCDEKCEERLSAYCFTWTRQMLTAILSSVATLSEVFWQFLFEILWQREIKEYESVVIL